ncbi:MAG: hypothetical protein RL160_780 [Bacteroidota bacterium]|jgi:hypothetical protein
MKKLFFIAMIFGAVATAHAQNVDAAGNEIKPAQSTNQPSVGQAPVQVTPVAVTEAPAITATPATAAPAKACCKAKTGQAACAGQNSAAAPKACCKSKEGQASTCTGHAHSANAAETQKPACNKPCQGHGQATPAAAPSGTNQ